VLAARAGAREVCSLELSPIISDVTSETVAAYLRERALAGEPGPPPSMRLFTSDVRALLPAQVGRHDVVVCELMDASGIGESVLGVLEHACRHFAAPEAQVIPCGLELHGALAWLRVPECHGGLDPAVLDGLFFCSRRGGALAESSGVPLPGEVSAGWKAAEPRPPTLQSGPFASKNLNRLRRGEAWDLLSPEVRLLDLDIAGALRGARLHPCEAEVELVASAAGVANCLHWWWTARLDEEETLSNRPVASGGGYQTHWHQPLVPLGPLPVRPGDRFRLRLSIGDAVGQKLAFSLAPAEPGSASAWLPRVLPALQPEPLAPLLAQWQAWLEQACDLNNGLIERYTRRGDLQGLAALQRAVQAIAAWPAVFRCGPHVRERLLSSYCGVSFK